MKTDRVLGTLLAISIALVGVVYSSLTARIEAVEKERQTIEQVARDAAVTAATVKVEIASLRQAVETVNAKVDVLTDRLAVMMAVISSNRKDYTRALNEWDAAVAAQRKKR